MKVPRSALVETVETVVNPESNTIELDRSYSVFVSVGDSVAERRRLELGIEQGDQIEVLSGLRPRDQIIITGQQGLEDGSKISVASGTAFQSPEQQTVTGDDAPPSGGRPNGEMFRNLTPEQREKLRDMSQEERRAFFQKLREQNADSTAKN